MSRQIKTVRNQVGSNIEDQIQCPFVPSHLLRREKFAHHLTKCRKSLTPDSPFYEKAMSLQVCRYNNTHYVPKEKLEEHYKTCESHKIVNTTFASAEKLAWEQNVAPLVRDEVSDEEDWDDSPVPTYDPSKKVLSNPSLLVIPSGKTRSERQKYRQERRLQTNGDEVNGFDWEDDHSWNDQSSDESSIYKIREKPKRVQRPRILPQQAGPKIISKVSDWSYSEDETDAATTQSNASTSQADARCDDLDDWEPPKTIPAPKFLHRPMYSSSSASQPSGAQATNPEAPQPTIMGIGRGAGRAKAVLPQGFTDSIASPLSTTTDNLNNLSLHPDVASTHPIGIGRGRGLGRGRP